MRDLISIEDAREHLRIDDESHDAWLESFIPAVSAAVATWLKDEWRLYVPAKDSSGEVIVDSSGDIVPETDDDGNPVVEPIVTAAVKMELGNMFRFRDGEGDVRMAAHEGYGYTLSRGATYILTSHRRPTVV